MSDRQTLQQIKGEIETYLGRADLQRTPHAEVSVEDLENWQNELNAVIAAMKYREDAGYRARFDCLVVEQEAALQELADQAQQLNMGYSHD